MHTVDISMLHKLYVYTCHWKYGQYIAIYSPYPCTEILTSQIEGVGDLLCTHLTRRASPGSPYGKFDANYLMPIY